MWVIYKCYALRVTTLKRKKNVELNEYQDEAYKTMLPSANNLPYLVSGLAGEVGELASLYAKAVRDGHEISQVDWRKELGDVLWFVAILADHQGVSLVDVARTNLAKLNKRKEQGTLTGSGDNR